MRVTLGRHRRGIARMFIYYITSAQRASTRRSTTCFVKLRNGYNNASKRERPKEDPGVALVLYLVDYVALDILDDLVLALVWFWLWSGFGSGLILALVWFWLWSGSGQLALECLVWNGWFGYWFERRKKRAKSPPSSLKK